MTNGIKVVRKELNSVTKLINEIPLCNTPLNFLVNILKLLLWEFLGVFYLGFVLRVMHYFFPLVVTELMYRNKYIKSELSTLCTSRNDKLGELKIS